MPKAIIFTFIVAITGLQLPQARSQDRCVSIVRDLVQPLIEQHVPEQEKIALSALAGAQAYPASFKFPLVELTHKDPWRGMEQFEKHGQEVVLAAQSSRPIVETLHAMSRVLPNSIATLNSTAPTFQENWESWDECLQYIREVLRASHELRDQAIEQLSQDEREFMFDHAAQLVSFFVCQSPVREDTIDRLRADLRFFTLIDQKVDWSKLLQSAETIARLTENDWVERFHKLARDRQPLEHGLEGVRGDLLWYEKTPWGEILIGGSGENQYEFDTAVGVLMDMGGNDSYSGLVGTNSPATGVSLLLDLAGNDSYQGNPLGLATGRLGVGMLVDLAGDDRFKLGDGAGGTGFAGIGVLHLKSGSNEFKGTRWTLGAAMGGLGLVLGGAGADRYHADIFSVGMAGPLSVAAVVDLDGSDQYRCGFQTGSGYNFSDAPEAKPGDPNFQFEGWGLGMGMGRRFYPWLTEKNRDLAMAQLAGGVGMLLDVKGDDHYQSSNFSQGCGYYFGGGLKIDLGGDDKHETARYGSGAGAHQAIGLAIDLSGGDHYHSTGPTYHGGCAWDHSAFMCIDAGKDNDVYELERTSGLGVADISSWGVFAQLGGNDQYRVSHGIGKGGSSSLAVFFDHFGDDQYFTDRERKNETVLIEDDQQSLFIDQE
jgi:hypothetical protein